MPTLPLRIPLAAAAFLAAVVLTGPAAAQLVLDVDSVPFRSGGYTGGP